METGLLASSSSAGACEAVAALTGRSSLPPGFTMLLMMSEHYLDQSSLAPMVTTLAGTQGDSRAESL